MRRNQRLLKYYPLATKLTEKLVVVIGGGEVAERKINSLLESAAKILLVSPEVTPKLRRLVAQKNIRWIRRKVLRKDIAGSYIIICATDDNEVNEEVSRWAQKRKTWINVVDKTVLCDFISPAVIRKDNCIIAVYTDGKDPKLSRDLKNYIKEQWDDFLSYRNRL